MKLSLNRRKRQVNRFWSRSRNQKRRVLRSSENQTVGVSSRGSDSAYDSVAYNLVKTRLWESQAERKYSEGLRTSIVVGLFFRFCLQLCQSSFHWIISDGGISGIGRK